MPDENHPLKVFICYARADESKARKVYVSMRKRGIDPWLDEIKLLPGHRWEEEISKALDRSDVIIVCLSKNAVDEQGHVQKEIRVAVDKALEMPEGSIFLIPARLEDSTIPYSLKHYKPVDLFRKTGYLKLMKALQARAAELGRTEVKLPQPNESNPTSSLQKAAIKKTILALTAQPPPEKPVKTKPPVIVEGKEAKEQLKPDQAKNVIIADNVPENAAVTPTIQPPPEKPVETKTPVIVGKKEPEKLVSSLPAKKREPQKQPRKLELKYILAMMGVATIVVVIACLAGIGIFFRISSSIATPTKTSTIIPFVDSMPTLTIIPTFTDSPLFTDTAVPSVQQKPEETTNLTATATDYAYDICTWTQKEKDVPPFLHNTCQCTDAKCICHATRDWDSNGIAPLVPSYTFPSRKQVDHWVLEYKGSCSRP